MDKRKFSKLKRGDSIVCHCSPAQISGYEANVIRPDRRVPGHIWVKVGEFEPGAGQERLVSARDVAFLQR